jgi:hypothetical protein
MGILMAGSLLAQSQLTLVPAHSNGNPLHKIERPIQDISMPLPQGQTPAKDGAVLQDAVTSIKIGEAANAYTFLVPGNHALSVKNGVGTGGGSVAFLARNNGANCGGSSGLYRYTLSTDGGTSWNVGAGTNSAATTPVIGCYGKGPLNPTLAQAGRYPSVTLFTPPGSSTVNDLRVAYGGAVLAASGAGWDGLVLGSASSVVGTPIVNQEVYPYSNGTVYFAYGMVERVPGEVWFVSNTFDGTNVGGNVNIHKGVYNPANQQFTWSIVTTLAPNYYLGFDGSPTFADLNIAFSPDGSRGYVVGLGDLVGGVDSTINMFYSESKDGGLSWGTPTEIVTNGICPEIRDSLQSRFGDEDTVNNVIVAAGSGLPTFGFDLDVVVDKNGNPHIIAVVGNGEFHLGDGRYGIPTAGTVGPGYSIFSGLEMFIINVTKDTFGDWNVMFLDFQEEFRGAFGSPVADPAGEIDVDPYVQASRSPDGSLVFLSWTDSDTANSNTGNDAPDLKALAYDVDANLTTPVINWTANDANWSSSALTPKVAPVALDKGNGVFAVPTAIMDLEGTDAVQPVSFWYFSDVQYNRNTQFTQQPRFCYNCKQAPLAATVTKTEPNCGVSDGKIKVVATGGVPPYTYQWSANAGAAIIDSVTGLGVGTYVVNVSDSKGCVESVSVTLNNLAAPTLGLTSVSNVTCNGASNGSATITTTGGTGPFSFVWSNGETGATADSLPPGVTSVTVTDAAGCVTSTTVTITEPAAVGGSVTATNVACAGLSNGTATVSATGGSGIFTYLWSNGDTGATADSLAGGTYTVTITDTRGCTATRTVNISQPAAINIGLSATPNTRANPSYNGTILASVSGGTGPYSYTWFGPQNLDSARSETSDILIGLCGGTYILRVTDAAGCVKRDTVVVPVGGPGVNCVSVVSITPAELGVQNLELFPNPAKGFFTLNLSLDKPSDLSVEVFSYNGLRVASYEARAAQTLNQRFDLSAQASGIYLVRIATPAGWITRKIVLE